MRMRNHNRILCFAVLIAGFAGTQAGWSQCRPNVASSKEVEYRLNRTSTRYDFVIYLVPDGHKAGELEGYCESPGKVVVFRKGSRRPLQTIAMRNIFVSFKSNGEPLTNSAPLYDNQGVINIGDFNFDGHEDFAVQNGNHGPYGLPTYDVYLFSTVSNRFELSRPLTQLIEQSLGFFEVDSIHKHLVTREKSGAVYHVMTAYAVIHDRPVPISRLIEDGRKAPGYIYVTNEHLVNGKWRRSVRRYDEAAYYSR
jgi:hypothetical protein